MSGSLTLPCAFCTIRYPNWGRVSRLRRGRSPVRVASIGDLIGLKRDAGRPQDLADAEALAHIARIRGDA
jgi:hypothetical protein